MRHLMLAALLAAPVLALGPASAQTTTPSQSNPTAGPSMTPAPVPAVPPAVPQTGAVSVPPERIAPPAGTESALPNAAPLSGGPAATSPVPGGPAEGGTSGMSR